MKSQKPSKQWLVGSKRAISRTPALAVVSDWARCGVKVSSAPWGCGAAGSAPRSQRGGQGFESPQLHQDTVTRTTDRENVSEERCSVVFGIPGRQVGDFVCCDANQVSRGIAATEVRLDGVADLLEGWVEDILGNGDLRLGLQVVQVEPLVERPVELSAAGVRGVFVHVGWFGDQLEAAAQPFGTEREFGGGVSHAALDAPSFKLDGVTALLDLGTGQHPVGCQVDEPFFADVQFGELFGQGLVD